MNNTDFRENNTDLGKNNTEYKSALHIRCAPAIQTKIEEVVEHLQRSVTFGATTLPKEQTIIRLAIFKGLETVKAFAESVDAGGYSSNSDAADIRCRMPVAMAMLADAQIVKTNPLLKNRSAVCRSALILGLEEIMKEHSQSVGKKVVLWNAYFGKIEEAHTSTRSGKRTFKIGYRHPEEGQVSVWATADEFVFF